MNVRPEKCQTIVVVEDNPALRHLLVETLHEKGYEVVSAKDAEEGLVCILSRHPDLVVGDILLPHMDGIEMVAEIRKDAWGSTVPVLILTNVDSADKIAHSLELGVHDYLVKSDCGIDDLVIKIQKILS